MLWRDHRTATTGPQALPRMSRGACWCSRRSHAQRLLKVRGGVGVSRSRSPARPAAGPPAGTALPTTRPPPEWGRTPGVSGHDTPHNLPQPAQDAARPRRSESASAPWGGSPGVSQRATPRSLPQPPRRPSHSAGVGAAGRFPTSPPHLPRQGRCHQGLTVPPERPAARSCAPWTATEAHPPAEPGHDLAQRIAQRIAPRPARRRGSRTPSYEEVWLRSDPSESPPGPLRASATRPGDRYGRGPSPRDRWLRSGPPSAVGTPTTVPGPPT